MHALEDLSCELGVHCEFLQQSQQGLCKPFAPTIIMSDLHANGGVYCQPLIALYRASYGCS